MNMLNLFDEAIYLLEDLNLISDEISEILKELSGSSAATVIAAVVIVCVLVVVAVKFTKYLLECVALYSVAKKIGYKKAAIAWVPVFGSWFRRYVLVNICSDKDFVLFGKRRFKSRRKSFWVYVIISFCGGTLIDILSLIPGAGQVIMIVGTILSVIPSTICAVMDYVYLRDVLDMFRKNRKANKTLAITATVLDSLLTSGFARIFCLYTVIRKDPVPEPPPSPDELIDANAVPVTEPAEAEVNTPLISDSVQHQ